jgi:hypothetical protein
VRESERNRKKEREREKERERGGDDPMLMMVSQFLLLSKVGKKN